MVGSKERGKQMGQVPGAGTLGFGFDITKRYDGESTTRRIFKEGANTGQVTIGTTVYGVPANVAVEIKPDTDGITSVFSDRQLVQDYFSAKAGITPSGFGFTAHFDAPYSHISPSHHSSHYSPV